MNATMIETLFSSATWTQCVLYMSAMLKMSTLRFKFEGYFLIIISIFDSIKLIWTVLDAWGTLLIVDNWQFHVVVRKLDDNDGID